MANQPLPTSDLQASMSHYQATAAAGPSSTPASGPNTAAIPSNVNVVYQGRSPLASTSRLPSTSSTSSSRTKSPNELLERVRAGLEQVLQTSIDARPSRQVMPQPKIGSCTNCRATKAKCSQGPVCTRCAATGQHCEYPVFAKRGRKRAMTPNMILLESIHRDVEQVLSQLDKSSSDKPSPRFSRSSLSPPARSNSLSSEAVREEPDHDAHGLQNVIESPLAVLAHISSLKITESTEEESGNTLSLLPASKHDSTPAEAYFSTGLYQARTDRETMLDPVTLGILSEQDLDRLVNTYFKDLRRFCWHLSPEIHTPRFLRDTSPFLTTALAYTCAGFCPLSHHLVPSLQNHMLFLSDRVFSEGHKTVEIVQAYCLLVHWAPIENNWGDDRRWGWLGQAIRIATEIRLDKTLTDATFQFYRSVTTLSPDAFTLLSQDRSRTWTMLAVAEIALCVSTGRLGAVQGLNLSEGFRRHVQHVDRSSPHYDLCALEELHKIYAKAISLSAGLKEEASTDDGTLREAFNASWMQDMQEWSQRWPEPNGYVKLVRGHSRTILLSISLRFKGPMRPILAECKASAVDTLKISAGWPDDSLEFASNMLVVNIAYAATLLLRITPVLDLSDSETAEIRGLCRQASDVLAKMGQRRPLTRTLPSLHATRCRALLDASEPARHLTMEPAPLADANIFQTDPALVASFFPSTIPFFPSAASTPMMTPQGSMTGQQPADLQQLHQHGVAHQQQDHQQHQHQHQQVSSTQGLPHDLTSTDDFFNVSRMQPVPSLHSTQFGLPGDKNWPMSDENWGATEPGAWAW